MSNKLKVGDRIVPSKRALDHNYFWGWDRSRDLGEIVNLDVPNLWRGFHYISYRNHNGDLREVKREMIKKAPKLKTLKDWM